jgi:hypothetical protein
MAVVRVHVNVTPHARAKYSDDERTYTRSRADPTVCAASDLVCAEP